MTTKFQETASYRGIGSRAHEEVQVGTYDEFEYVVYYYQYGTVVDRTYHSNVKSALQTAEQYIWSEYDQKLDS
jgi:hypothetical protein